MTDLAIIVVSAMSGVLGWMIFAPFGKAGHGLVLGLLLGPFGVLIAAVQRSNWKEEAERRQQYLERRRQNEDSDERARIERECPRCAGVILRRVEVCKHCGRDVPAEAQRS